MQSLLDKNIKTKISKKIRKKNEVLLKNEFNDKTYVAKSKPKNRKYLVQGPIDLSLKEYQFILESLLICLEVSFSQFPKYVRIRNIMDFYLLYATNIHRKYIKKIFNKSIFKKYLINKLMNFIFKIFFNLTSKINAKKQFVF